MREGGWPLKKMMCEGIFKVMFEVSFERGWPGPLEPFFLLEVMFEVPVERGAGYLDKSIFEDMFEFMFEVLSRARKRGHIRFWPLPRILQQKNS